MENTPSNRAFKRIFGADVAQRKEAISITAQRLISSIIFKGVVIFLLSIFWLYFNNTNRKCKSLKLFG